MPELIFLNDDLPTPLKIQEEDPDFSKYAVSTFPDKIFGTK